MKNINQTILAATAVFALTTTNANQAAGVNVDFADPAGGWAYAYSGSGDSAGLFSALDGTWFHFNSDQWDGSAPGVFGDPSVDANSDSPGGVIALAESGVDYLRIQDAGFPSAYDDNPFDLENANWNDPSNRKIYFAHDILSDGNPGAGLANVLNDGLTLSFRARIASSGTLDQVYNEGGSPSPTSPWPVSGKGYSVSLDARGMFGVEQSGSQTLGFSLALSDETPAGIGGGLIMNNSSDLVGTEDATPETANLVAVSDADLLDWNEFWITIEEASASHWKVDVYTNGSTTAETFLARKRNATEYSLSSLVMGLSSGTNFGAVDVDFYAYRLGIVTPVPEPTTFDLLMLGLLAVFFCSTCCARKLRTTRKSFLQRLFLGILTVCFPLGAVASAAHVSNPLSFVFDDGVGTPMPYRLFLPPNHDEPGRSFPLAVYLHSGGRGGTDNNFSLNPIEGLINATQSARFESFLLVPQYPPFAGWFYSGDPAAPLSLDMTLKIMNQLETQYSIDPARRYVTGYSAGGFGSWNFITARPDLFAAAMPMAGGGDPAQAANIKDVRTWVFHGRNDTTVPTHLAREMVQSLREAGGSPLYTETTGGHGIFDIRGRYDDPADELYPWLFEGVSPSLASLIYNTRNGNLQLVASEAPGGLINQFALKSADEFSLPPTMVVDGVTMNTNDFLGVATTSNLIFSAAATAGVGGVIDLGNILPAGLDFQSVSDALTFQAYTSPDTAAELRFFQVFVVNVPEPSAVALALAGMSVVLSTRLFLPKQRPTRLSPLS